MTPAEAEALVWLVVGGGLGYAIGYGHGFRAAVASIRRAIADLNAKENR